MCSTCFPDKLMQAITEKLSTLKNGLRIATLKRLPKHKDFTFLKELKLAMTWSQKVSVYLYKLNKAGT